MKTIFFKLRSGAMPLILCIALVVTGFQSAQSITNLEGDARVINYAGIVRGATQRLIKKELNHVPDDKLISHLDDVLAGLCGGSDEYNIIRLDDSKYQALLEEMKDDWDDIKSEIYLYRSGDSSGDHLFEMSENYFDLADQTVLAAEVYTEKIVQHSRNALFFMNLLFIVLTALCAIFTYYQSKRRDKLLEAENENRLKSEQLSKRFENLLIPMNEISELMYVSDINTYELLFVNEAGKKTFQISAEEQQKCYKVLQGFDSPCPFCTNSRLKKDENYTWEHTNPITKRHYLLKDRLLEWEGHAARMEIAFDITDAANEKRELKNRLERDNILVECIRELYRNHDALEATSYVLEQVGKLFLAERSYVFLFHGDNLSNVAEWCREDVIPQIDYLQNLPQSDFAIWFNMFRNQENIVIDDLENIKSTMKLEYEFMTQQGIKSVIMVPLEREGRLDGCIGLDNPSCSIKENAVTFLDTLRYFIMLAIRRNEDEETLYRLSYLDTLTNFYNRNRYIQDINSLEDKNIPIGIVYLDVNGLKEVNDHYGHDSGDNLLKKCAELMQNSFNQGSYYRIGGDEFIIICTDISQEIFSENIHKLKYNFAHNDCKAAIGYEWAEDCHNIQSIIKTADENMYADKKEFYHNHRETGRYRHRNDVLDFLSDPDVLETKLQNKQFQVYLQAKIELESRSVVGAEALVRYIDDDGVVQSPDKFITILERSYQISKIDFYVFEMVCAQLKEWQKQEKAIFPISSNFSRSTFMDDAFLKRLESIVSNYGIAKEYLEIEITESTCSTDFRSLRNKISQIRNAGFRISVDDFGAESSNLALLATAKFDILKIDRGFVKDIISNENTQTIVEAIVSVCKKLNIQLVAEGVENESQLEVLENCGVKTVQGFLFSKPMPMTEYEWKNSYK
ncbi:sensor domain-containing phosphodiesterase [Robinsoniella peoriensis]|uniref:sensor domain-containing phosphodiesterase n=1 Tax=Robinsoniella peoriensis TaxID=180332 RepID=UPI00362754EC